MTEPRAFDASRSALRRGTTLIEASAGTGKTFAIAMLVLRAVVELGIPIDRVLVVTFTIAATDELRGRIRRRLSEARELLLGHDAAPDEALREWRAGISDCEQAVKRLQEALYDIDRASITTIHGFCQKVLSEQALASGQFFDFEIIATTAAVRDEVVRDFWRATVYPLGPRYLSLVLSEYAAPGALYASIRGAENISARLLPEPFSFADTCAEFDRALTAFTSWWERSAVRLLDCLRDAAEAGFLKSSLAEGYPARCSELDHYLGKRLGPPLAVAAWLDTESLAAELNRSSLRSADKRELLLAGWPLPGPVYEDYRRAASRLLLALRLALATELRLAVGERLRRRSVLCFDDLVTSLAHALKGPAADTLRRNIAASYRVALIDEFQDTDRYQWFIFSSLFGGGAGYLYLIGDPKQAIYRFRGADIQSYLSARRQAGARLTLRRNYRSHPAILAGINDLFAGMLVAGIPYPPAEPAKKPGDYQLCAGDDDCSGFVYCQLEPRSDSRERWSGSAAEEAIGAWIADETVALLNGTAGVRLSECDAEKGENRRALRPADVAVLVRTNRQAEAYRDWFAQRGVPAVISSKKAVFATGEAAELLLVMEAVAEPEDSRLLKSALACDWFGLSGENHFELCRDDQAFNRVQERFQGYLETWRSRGALPMLSRLLENEQVFVHLADSPRAERRISNIEQLSELVQEAEQRGRFTIPRTLSWLQEEIGEKREGEENELRLESDRAALTIVTMHGAKGLEFPIVFAPFLLVSSSRGTASPIVRCHTEEGIVCDLGSEHISEHRQRELAEEKEEELRLAYVAITRARLRCYLFWADIKGWRDRPGSFGAPLGRILFRGETPEFEGQLERLQQLASRQLGGYRLVPAAATTGAARLAKAPDTRALTPRPPGKRPLQTNRIRTSFSALALLSRAADEDRPGAFDEASREAGSLESGGLPGGVRFGNVVHDLLELVDFRELAEESWDPELADTLCRRYHLEVDRTLLAGLLRRSVTTPLTASGEVPSFCLADIEADCCVRELEFSLAVAPTSTGRLNEILGSAPACRPLRPLELEGYVNGFIDLVCRYRNRYYVIDYKTNNLGDTAGDYGPEQLQQAMRSHNYGLQYWIYSLVVHRHLARWQPGYRYREHFGGVFYCFVRGMDPQRPGSGVYFDRPDAALVERFDGCFRGQGVT